MVFYNGVKQIVTDSYTENLDGSGIELVGWTASLNASMVLQWLSSSGGSGGGKVYVDSLDTDGFWINVVDATGSIDINYYAH